MDTGNKFMGCASASNGKVIDQSEIKLCTYVSKDNVSKDPAARDLSTA
jgi:hypothetical protein